MSRAGVPLFGELVQLSTLGMSDHGLMVRRGGQVPLFEVRTLDGDLFRYSTVWQHRNLVLIALPGDAPAGTGVAFEQVARSPAFQHRHSVCVITRDRVPGLEPPAALVADRWGEIVYLTAVSDVNRLPAPSDLLDWLDYVERRCPECEGEAR
jgi:hypothetical protein